MKRLLTVTLLLLLCVACVAEDSDLPALARSRGFTVDIAEGGGALARCDLTVGADGTAAMAWTKAAQLYTVSGGADALARLYLDALAMGGWEACAYTAEGVAKLSFGVDSARRLDTLDAYAAELRVTLGLTSLANALLGVTRSYVLNKRSKKFHYPDCSGIRDMNPKNREDYTGTRDAVIAMGYSPCGICRP